MEKEKEERDREKERVRRRRKRAAATTSDRVYLGHMDKGLSALPGIDISQ